MPTLPVLRRYYEGPSVRLLQNNLIGLNYTFNGMQPTGVFDEKTLEAVEAFQAEHRLQPDGIVGPLTWGALTNEVKRVQSKLDSLNYIPGPADGIFGAKTTDAVRRFQSVNGLAVTGTITPRTRQQMWNPNPRDDFSRRPTNNSIDALDPYVATLARRFLEQAKANGLDVKIISVFRSWDEQDRLYAQGRTAPGPIVTDAMGGDSYHTWALAFDAVPLKNGQVDYNDTALFTRMGRIGEQVGLEWGGNWQTVKVNLIDMPHFQYTFGLTTAQLLEGARPPR